LNNLRGKRILVTGGAGFLGSYVVERLQSYEPSDVFVPRKAEYDLTTEDGVARVFEDSRPDIVIHLAAQVGGIGANQASPGRFFYENLIMGTQMMEGGRQYGLDKFVAVGSVCAYPKYTEVPFRESSLWDGYPESTNAPYGLAKKMLLVQAQAYRDEYGFNAIYLLPTNLYGPRDNFSVTTSHVIPAMIRKCTEAVRDGRSEVVFWGTGQVSREFLYVADAADAICLAANSYNERESVNVGAGSEIQIATLATLIAKLTGFYGRISWDSTKPDGQPRRCLDTTKADEWFGFKASMPLEAGLMKTIEWFATTQKDHAALQHTFRS
jgi:GDP-L-fucose synthase